MIDFHSHIQLIGSDCHHQNTWPPNLGAVRRQMKKLGLEGELRRLHENAARLLQGEAI